MHVFSTTRHQLEAIEIPINAAIAYVLRLQKQSSILQLDAAQSTEFMSSTAPS